MLKTAESPESPRLGRNGAGRGSTFTLNASSEAWSPPEKGAGSAWSPPELRTLRPQAFQADRKKDPEYSKTPDWVKEILLPLHSFPYHCCGRERYSNVVPSTNNY